MSGFVLLSLIEGIMICLMLGWEVFWLRRMYTVLWNMPTSEQVTQMVAIMRADGEAIKAVADVLAPKSRQRERAERPIPDVVGR